MGFLLCQAPSADLPWAEASFCISRQGRGPQERRGRLASRVRGRLPAGGILLLSRALSQEHANSIPCPREHRRLPNSRGFFFPPKRNAHRSTRAKQSCSISSPPPHPLPTTAARFFQPLLFPRLVPWVLCYRLAFWGLTTSLLLTKLIIKFSVFPSMHLLSCFSLAKWALWQGKEANIWGRLAQ